MARRWLLSSLMGLVMLAGSTSEAAKWNRQYIRRLPDSAFAIIETAPEGRRVRHLPHHDASGALDVPHLCNALVRLGQVKWRDPANAEMARRHLREHLEQVGHNQCHPTRKGPR